MNEYAQLIGYIMMILGAPLTIFALLYGLYAGIIWLTRQVPFISRAMVQKIWLGHKAYMALPKDQRKGWPKK